MFGMKMRCLRKKLRMSQQELGCMINKPQTTISDWETGKQLPNISEAVRLANALGVKITDLLEDQAS